MKIAIAVVSLFALVTCATNYCQLCTSHIACNINGEFNETCVNPSLVEMTSETKQIFLDTHNEVRNTIAGGGQSGFSNAAKMSFMDWNDELAYFAELNVKKCKMSHDLCFKSIECKNPGQNIFSMSEYPSYAIDIKIILRNAVLNWYNEVTKASQTNINSCCGGKNISSIGHFTQVVRDSAISIGCASSRYEISGWKRTLVTCNYCFGNLLNTAVYETGTSASSCVNGTHEIYTNLCI